MRTIGVSDFVKNKLDSMKTRNGHTSMDSLLRNLISNPCKGTKCIGYGNCIEFGCSNFKEETEKVSSIEQPNDIQETIE